MTTLRAEVEKLPWTDTTPRWGDDITLDDVLAIIDAHDDRIERLAAAARAVCRMDLRDDFPDGGDIILRWEGNRADWQALRALLAPETDQ